MQALRLWALLVLLNVRLASRAMIPRSRANPSTVYITAIGIATALAVATRCGAGIHVDSATGFSKRQ
jgi:hypothetical protein